jgi:hypothetical protein
VKSQRNNPKYQFTRKAGEKRKKLNKTRGGEYVDKTFNASA